MIALMYGTDNDLAEDVRDDLDRLAGKGGWSYSVREIRPDLVYETTLHIPGNVSFVDVADLIDASTGGTCLIVQDT